MRLLFEFKLNYAFVFFLALRPGGPRSRLHNWKLSTFFCLDTKESCKEKVKAAEKLPECSFLRLKQTNSGRKRRPSNSVCFLAPLFIHTLCGNFPKANFFLSAKDLSSIQHLASSIARRPFIKTKGILCIPIICNFD